MHNTKATDNPAKLLDAGKADGEILNTDEPLEDGWLKVAIVTGDDYERDLLDRLRPLDRDMSACLYFAKESEHPEIWRTNLRTAITALRSMLQIVAALDAHRHGRDGVNEKSATDALAKSDALLEEFVLLCIQLLDSFVGRCRREAQILGDTPQQELRGVGQFRGPDRRSWQAEFLQLAAYLSGQAAELSSAIRARRSFSSPDVQARKISSFRKSKTMSQRTRSAAKGARPARSSFRARTRKKS